MERRPQRERGPWERPHYNSEHSPQPDPFQQPRSHAVPRAGPHSECPRNRPQAPQPRDIQDQQHQRPEHGQGGNPMFGDSRQRLSQQDRRQGGNNVERLSQHEFGHRDNAISRGQKEHGQGGKLMFGGPPGPRLPQQDHGQSTSPMFGGSAGQRLLQQDHGQSSNPIFGSSPGQGPPQQDYRQGNNVMFGGPNQRLPQHGQGGNPMTGGPSGQRLSQQEHGQGGNLMFGGQQEHGQGSISTFGGPPWQKVPQQDHGKSSNLISGGPPGQRLPQQDYRQSSHLISGGPPGQRLTEQDYGQSSNQVFAGPPGQKMPQHLPQDHGQSRSVMFGGPEQRLPQQAHGQGSSVMFGGPGERPSQQEHGQGSHLPFGGLGQRLLQPGGMEPEKYHHEASQAVIPQQGGVQPAIFPRVDVSHHGGKHSNGPVHAGSHLGRTEQRIFPQNTQQSECKQSGNAHFGGILLEGPPPNMTHHKGPHQDTDKTESSQHGNWGVQNTPLSRDYKQGISLQSPQPEIFNPAASMNKLPPNDLFHFRPSAPGIAQPRPPQLQPVPVQNPQFPNNPVPGHFNFPPPFHGPHTNHCIVPSPQMSAAIPAFHPPPSQVDVVFNGPQRESKREVSHLPTQIQHPEGFLNPEQFKLHTEERFENAAVSNVHGQGDHLHQEMRPGFRPQPFTSSEMECVQNNPFVSKTTTQIHDTHISKQEIMDGPRDLQAVHQHFNERRESSFYQNRPSEMLMVKEDPTDMGMFQQWLSNFLAFKRKKFTPRTDSVQSVSITEARGLIYDALSLVSQLRSLCQTLENKEDGESWTRDYEKAKDIRVVLQRKMKELEKPRYIQSVKQKLDRVRKKRLRMQQRRLDKEEEEKEAAERAAEKEAKIDSWRMRCIHEVEERKKERELKTVADSVLGEVRKKQSDAKKMLEVLKSLEKLRKLRKEAAARKGVSPPTSADETFKNHINRLRTMVHKRTALYDAEEKTLRVILEGEQEEERQRDKDKRMRKMKEKVMQKQRELDSILFGDEELLPSHHPLQPFRQYYLQAEHSVVSLVQIRHEWDRFLTPPDRPDASSIPQGWVLPVLPSSEAWATALKQAE